MRPAMSENRDFQAAAREHLFAHSEAAAAWLPGQRRLNGPAAILPTATSRGSRSARSGPTAYSKYIGRVGALAIALGVGGAIAWAPGLAWADESSSTTSGPRSSASSSASDESSKSTLSASSSSSAGPGSTTSSEDSTDDESGGQGTGTSSSTVVKKRHLGQKHRDDEAGVIVGGPDGSQTSAANEQSVPEGQQEEAAAPDLEQPTTSENEVALQPPPETPVTTPPAAPTPAVAPTKKNSDTKRFAPLTAPTRAVTPTNNTDTQQVASRSADAPAVWTEMGEAGRQVRPSAVTPTAGETDEWNDKSAVATSRFTTPPASASSARALVDLTDDHVAPLQHPGPMGPVSTVMWSVIGLVRRQF